MADPDIDNTYKALKYPGFHTWRDLDAAFARGGYWPSGEVVRLSDPEMKPRMDELREKLIADPEFRDMFLQDYRKKLDTPPK